MGKVIAVFSTTGGVGVSTVAAYLAYILAGENETAVVDMVPDFGCVGDYYGFSPKLTSGKFPVLFGRDSSNLLQELALPRRSKLKLFVMPPAAVSPQQID